MTHSASLISPTISSQPSTITGPSLKTKESSKSVGSPSSSDDISLNGDLPATAGTGTNASSDVLANGAQSLDASKHSVAIEGTDQEKEQPEKSKTKKLKKYKEGAEKMFSLFSSPRQQPQQQHS